MAAGQRYEVWQAITVRRIKTKAKLKDGFVQTYSDWTVITPFEKITLSGTVDASGTPVIEWNGQKFFVDQSDLDTKCRPIT